MAPPTELSIFIDVTVLSYHVMTDVIITRDAITRRDDACHLRLSTPTLSLSRSLALLARVSTNTCLALIYE